MSMKFIASRGVIPIYYSNYYVIETRALVMKVLIYISANRYQCNVVHCQWECYVTGGGIHDLTIDQQRKLGIMRTQL